MNISLTTIIIVRFVARLPRSGRKMEEEVIFSNRIEVDDDLYKIQDWKAFEKIARSISHLTLDTLMVIKSLFLMNSICWMMFIHRQSNHGSIYQVWGLQFCKYPLIFRSYNFNFLNSKTQYRINTERKWNCRFTEKKIRNSFENLHRELSIENGKMSHDNICKWISN